MIIKSCVTFFFISCCTIFLFFKPAHEGGYKMKCTFNNLPNKTKVYLVTQENDTLHTTTSIGDKFTFEGQLPLNGRFHFIRIDSNLTKVQSKAIFVENTVMTVNGEVGKGDVVVTGSKSHDDYKSLLLLFEEQNKRHTYFNKIVSSIAREKLYAEKRGDSAAVDTLRKSLDVAVKVLNDVIDARQDTIKMWVGKHLNSLYTPYALDALILEVGTEYTKNTYDKLSPDSKNSYYGDKLKTSISMHEEATLIKMGALIPNFKVEKVTGQNVGIVDIIKSNKLTLIDCWASWCSPCRAEIPTLLNTYKRFKDEGFAIVGLSLDNDKSAWNKAIKEDNTPWMHTLAENKDPLEIYFGIRAIPAYILVDNTGRLLAFDCAMSSTLVFGGSLRGDSLDIKIKHFLSKN